MCAAVGSATKGRGTAPEPPEREEEAPGARGGEERTEEGGAEPPRRGAERATLAPDEERGRGERGEGDGEAHLPRPRPGDDREGEHVEPRPRLGPALLEVLGGEGADEGEGGLPLVLDRGGVEVGEVVPGRVVADRAGGEREVDAGRPGGLEDRQVGVVREERVERGGDRRRHRARQRRERPREPERRAARVEEDRRPLGAARLEVHDRPRFLRGGVSLDERGRAHEPGLLAVGDEEHHRPRQRRAGDEGPGGLDDGGGAGEVVGGARPRAHRVVVRRDHDGAPPGTRGAEPGDDVPDRGAGAVPPAPERLLHRRLEAEGAEPGDEPVDRPAARCRADRPRRAVPRELAGDGEGARCGELGRRRVGATRRGRSESRRDRDRERGGEDERRGEAGGGAHSRSFTARLPCARRLGRGPRTWYTRG